MKYSVKSDTYLKSPCGILSGGEKIKLKLVELLGDKPTVLILDEPTNHMDIRGIEFLEEELKRFSGTLLIVSHEWKNWKELGKSMKNILKKKGD